MESFATPYPILFYDGEQEHDKGHVGLHSVLTFKRFKALLAQKTGIPANQLSAVFVCRRTLKDIEKRQKLPINENTNFNIILNQHNPSRERDCHFLVLMKKSKKERKGGSTRKRNAEAEVDNGDDDDSISSWGDISPLDEGPKVERTHAIFSPKAMSPWSFDEQPSPPMMIKPVSSYGRGQQKTSNNGSPSGNEKLPLNRLAEYKVEKTLLRRDEAMKNGFASLRPSSNGGTIVPDQRLEGFTISSSAGVLNSDIQIARQAMNESSALKIEDRRKMDKHWMQSSPNLDDHETFRQFERATINGHSTTLIGTPSQGLNESSLRADLYRYDMFNDSIPQANGVRPTSVVMGVRENGVSMGLSNAPHAGSGFQRNSNSMISCANGATRSTTTIAPTPRTFIPRASMASGGATFANPTMGGLTLRQAQAHRLHLQQLRQSSLGGTMSWFELSKLNGMLCGLVARDKSRGETAKICKLCYILREKNSGPPPFHWCVDDTITKGFRGPSPAGPIGRPVKQHVEAAA